MKFVVRKTPLDGTETELSVPRDVHNPTVAVLALDGQPVAITTWIELSQQEKNEIEVERQRAALARGAASPVLVPPL